MKPFYKNLCSYRTYVLRQDLLCFIGIYSKELMTFELEPQTPQSQVYTVGPL